MGSNNGYTPTQRAMLNILADGKPHTRHELHTCLMDDLGALSNINFHICVIRGKLRPKGMDIICELSNRRIMYRQVRLLGSTHDGYH